MPPLLAVLPIIAAVTSIAGTGVGLGLELSNQPGSPKPPTTPTQTPAQQNATQQQERSLISQQTPNILSSTSGLANPGYVEQIASLLSGTAGQPGSTGAANSAVASAFGFNQLPGTPKSFTPAGSAPNTGNVPPTQLSDFVNSFLT